MKKIYFILLIVLMGNITNAQYTKIFDFDGFTSGVPQRSLISDGTFLYGMTTYGGTNNMGTVFRILPDGSDYLTLLEFTGAANGGLPYGSLVTDSTYLYGMTSEGGLNNMGTIFKIKTDGSSGTTLHNFVYPIAFWPYGSLIYDGTYLYGMTKGLNVQEGTIFRIMPDGSSYQILLNLTSSTGTLPQGSLISDDTFLYGMTRGGGLNGNGTIFKIKPDGSSFVKLLDFDYTTGTTPYGSLISDGNFLYGMTQNSGTGSDGTIFKIMTDGSNYEILHGYTDTLGGGDPLGSLIFEGNFLYGMTSYGGINNMGTIFRLKPDGSDYVKLFEFTGTNGSEPWGSFISDGNFLYGMTRYGGTNNSGVIFKYGLVTGITETNNNTVINIYPNPTTGKITIQAEEIERIEIMDLQGKAVYIGKETKIDLSTQPKGIYIIKVITDKQTITRKVIRQ